MSHAIELIVGYADRTPLDVAKMSAYVEDVMLYFDMLINLPINDYTLCNIVEWVNHYINHPCAQQMLDILLNERDDICLHWCYTNKFIDYNDRFTMLEKYSKAATCTDVGMMLTLQRLVKNERQ